MQSGMFLLGMRPRPTVLPETGIVWQCMYPIVLVPSPVAAQAIACSKSLLLSDTKLSRNCSLYPCVFLFNAAPRSARLAAQKAPLETISLDDGDTDNLVSANFDCADCGESGASIHTPLCNYAAHKGCNDDGVDAPCVFCQRTCAI